MATPSIFTDPAGYMASVKQARDAANQDSLQRQATWAKQQRQQDMAEGLAAGQKMFSSGSLGRIDANSSQDVADIIAQRRQQMNGFTPQEMNAYREEGVNNINQGLQTNLRQLRSVQGSNGIRGGMAAGQQAQLLRGAQQAQAQNERDLFLKNIDAKRTGLDKMEQSTMDREKFNIGQQNKEKFGQQATEFGYAGLGAAERGGIMQQILGQEQADATAQAAANSGKK